MTIRLTVRLFGTLSSGIPDYDHKKGLRVDAKENATPEDLLNHLKIPLNHVGLISRNNRAIQFDTPLSDGMALHLFSLVSGG